MARRYRHVYAVGLVFLTIWTIACVVPGPGLKLAQQVWYVSFISHLALIISLIPAWHATRVEENQENGTSDGS